MNLASLARARCLPLAGAKIRVAFGARAPLGANRRQCRARQGCAPIWTLPAHPHLVSAAQLHLAPRAPAQQTCTLVPALFRLGSARRASGQMCLAACAQRHNDSLVARAKLEDCLKTFIYRLHWPTGPKTFVVAGAGTWPIGCCDARTASKQRAGPCL